MVDWPGLLKWSLSQSDSTRPSEFRPMDESTRQWLKEAFESFAFQEKEKLTKIAAILSTPETGGSEELSIKESILEELMSIIDNPELAANFIAYGGIAHLTNCMLGSRYLSVRRLSAQIFSSAAQNNPSVQSFAHTQGVLQGLMEAVRMETDVAAKESYMSSLSALVRGEFEQARKDFVASGGVELMKLVIEAAVSLRMLKKSLLLLVNLFYYDKCDPTLQAFARAVSSGLISVLLALEAHSDLEVRQMTLQALFNLKREAPETAEIVRGIEAWRERLQRRADAQEELTAIDEILRGN